jgi:hypothetical protein
MSGPSSDIEVLAGTVMVVTIFAGAIQLAGLTRRSIRSELQGRTLSTLMLLPLSTRRLLLHKLCGCAQSLIPELFFFILATALVPGILLDFLSEAPILIFFYFVAQLAFILYLVAFYSLILKRGILGLVLLTWILTQSVSSMLTTLLMFAISFGSPDLYLLLHSVIFVVLAVFLHRKVIERIHAKAAEE